MSNYRENNGKKYALIFSCPGQKELKENRPCAGRTGKNLELLLDSLKNANKKHIPINRNDYLINNSWPIVEYRKVTGRSEAEDYEILQEWNMIRLKEEINGVETAIVFGNKAKIVIEKIVQKYNMNIKIIESIHLSMRSINFTIKDDINNRPIKNKDKNATKKRIEVLANKIYSKW